MNRIELPKTRKVGHLTLLRQGREISLREYNALNLAERLNMVRRAHGREKYNLLLAADDTEQMVANLASQEIYLLLREMGLEDMSELVSVLSPEQLTLMIDLDAWQGDRVDSERLLIWLQLLLEAGPRKVAEVFTGTDPELAPAMLIRFVRVVQGPEAYDDEDVEKTPQLAGLYTLDYCEGEAAKTVAAVLDALLKEAPNYYVWLLEAMRAETPSVLEELAFIQHRGRMLDHGFADSGEAHQIYSYLDPHHFAPEVGKAQVLSPEETALPPAYLLRTHAPADLLGEVLAEGADESSAWEFSLLLNRIMIADAVDVGEPAQVSAAVDDACRYVNLGLEHLSEGQVERALEVFQTVYLLDLFRIGFSLTLELKHWAVKLKQSPVAPFLDTPYQQVLAQLDQPRPQLSQLLEPQPQSEARPFAVRADLRQATRWLEEIEAQHHLFAGALPFRVPEPADVQLEGCLPSRAEDLCLSHLLLTALANKLLDRECLPLPLTADQLIALHGSVTTDGQLDPQLREGTVEWLEEMVVDAGSFGHFCLDIWQENFCRLSVDSLDLRFDMGVIVSLEA